MKTSDKITELRKGLRDSNKEEIVIQEFAKTGCLLTDILYGGGVGLGIPYGVIIDFVGDTSSGKSMSGNELIAAEYHHRKKGTFHHQYEDAEYGNKFDTSKMFGLDIMGKNVLANIPKKKYPTRPKTVQEVDARVSVFIGKIPKNHYGIYFWDSVDAVSNEENIKRSVEREDKYSKKGDVEDTEDSKKKDKGTYGMQTAKFLSQEFFRIQGSRIADKKIIIAMVSQVRTVIGATTYQKKTKDSGGKAKGHWVSMKVWFTPKGYLYMPGSERAYGQIFDIKMDKSRDGKIKRSVTIVYDTGHGIDDVKTSLDFLWDCRNQKTFKLKKSAGEIDFISILKPTIKKKYEKELKETYHYSELHKLIRKNKDFKKALDVAVIKKWNDLEEAASSGVGSKYG